MSGINKRRLPLCAYCGLSLKTGGARMLAEYTKIPGVPMLGWHMGNEDPTMQTCFMADDSRLIHKQDEFGEEDIPALIADIERRGPGRVTRNAIRSLSAGQRGSDER